MNIFLVPYTWMRHLNMALICGAAGLFAWWLVLAFTMHFTWWSEAADGPLFLTTVAVFVSAASVLAEGALRRDVLWKRFVMFGVAAGTTLGLSQLWWWAWTSFTGPLLFPDVQSTELQDPSLVALRYRFLPFVTTGISIAVGTIAARRLEGFFAHGFSGVASGLVAAATWYGLAYPGWTLGRSDLYLASAAAAFAFGATFGLLAWGIPDRLYAGWFRVVSETRHGRRIPVDAPGGEIRERFVGHFPRGLDLFLPHEDQVMELHISVLVDQKQRYRLRGLTLQPTVVRRFLERLDMRYDPRRSAPLETELQSGDRIVLGKGKRSTVVEFLMLPREER